MQMLIMQMLIMKPDDFQNPFKHYITQIHNHTELTFYHF